MSHHRFVSTQPAPPGFVAFAPSKRTLLARPLVVYVGAISELANVLPDYVQRMQGVICLLGEQLEFQPLSAQLWRVQLPPEMLPTLQVVTQPLLVSIEHNVEMHERLVAAEHQVSRQQFELETLRQDYHRATTRLQQQLSDISQAEAAVRHSNEQLEQRVVQRTAQLEQLNRELESFSYSVSHDLRAPLRAIVGFTQNLQEDIGDKLDPLEQQMLRRILANGFRMNQLIDDLLTLARATQQPLQLSQLDLSRMALDIFERLCSGEACHATLQVQPGLHARGDARLISVVLENLLNNAIKFSRNRSDPQIRLTATENQGETVYQLQDNGAGFDMAWVNKLFNAFQRLHKETEFEGTGIGLATVKRVIVRHGGRIWADAAPDQGASFYFTLPPKDTGETT